MRERVKAAVKAVKGHAPRWVVLQTMRRYYHIGKEITDEQLDFYDKHGVEFGSLEFGKYLKAGLLSNPQNEIIENAKAYQQTMIGRSLDPVLHIAYSNMLGKENVRLLPRSFYWYHLIPYLNDMDYVFACSDKNAYTKVMANAEQPETLLKNINGNYFDFCDHPVPKRSLPAYLKRIDANSIIKPSRTDNGQKIKALARVEGGFVLGGRAVEWDEVEKEYGTNFIVQKTIVQHPVMAEPHPDSVNTLRILTLRWEGEIHYLLAFARFGSGGSVNDNAGTGGVCVGIDDLGQMMNYAIDANANKLDGHPTSGYEFAKIQTVPAFSDAKQLCLEMHRDILHHNLVSWDVAISENGKSIFIESNFKGSLWLYQLVTGKPILGDFSDDILKAMRQSKCIQ